MDELTLIKQLVTDQGPWYGAIIFLFVFLVKYFWPWFTGPYQEQLQCKWKAQVDKEKAKEAWVREMMDTIINITKEYQNGWRAASAAEHAEIIMRVEAYHNEVKAKLRDGPGGGGC